MKRFERVGVVLALLMAAGALGLEIEQRLGRAPGPGAAVGPDGAMTASGERGRLEPMPVPEEGKEILGTADDPIRMQGLGNGRKQYELSMERLLIGQGENTTAGEGIGGQLFGQDGKPTVRFTAERAVMDRPSHNLDIQGQVRVESTDPENPVLFETRDMHWNAREEKLVCPNPVRVSRRGMVLRGSRMVADVKLNKLSLEGNILLEADVDEVKKGLEAIVGDGRNGR